MRVYNDKTGELVGSISSVIGEASCVVVLRMDHAEGFYDYRGYELKYSQLIYWDVDIELSKITNINAALETKVNFKW